MLLLLRCPDQLIWIEVDRSTLVIRATGSLTQRFLIHYCSYRHKSVYRSCSGQRYYSNILRDLFRLYFYSHIGWIQVQFYDTVSHFVRVYHDPISHLQVDPGSSSSCIHTIFVHLGDLSVEITSFGINHACISDGVQVATCPQQTRHFRVPFTQSG